MAGQIASAGKSREVVARERPELLVACGGLGLVGNIGPIVAIAFAVGIAQHDFVADTISDLARGPHKWIMDLGFYVNAGGLIALAIGAAHAHLGRMAWSLGLFALAFTALVVTLLGLWDDLRAGPENVADMTVHTKLTFLLGPLYLAGPLLMARGIAEVHRIYGILFVAAAAIWIVFATAFKLAPTAYDGIIEKIAIGGTMLWTTPLAVLLLLRGLEMLRD
jgi:hypothetical protein